MRARFVLTKRMLRLHDRICKDSSWPGLSRPSRLYATDVPGDDEGRVYPIRKCVGVRKARIAFVAAALTASGFAQAQGQSQEQQPTREQIIESLRAKQLTRCPQPDPKYGCAGAPVAQIDVAIRFAFGSAALDRAAAAQLTALGAELAKPGRKGTRLVVAGHTDARGGDEFNQRLSERRADAVKRVLVAKFRLPDETVVAIGHGKAALKNTADPFAAENRRVEISAAPDPPPPLSVGPR
jgi:outer membrane protein OmpA-like peptidoglycan-associated protein